MKEHKTKPDFDLNLCLQKIKSKNRLNCIISVNIDGTHEEYDAYDVAWDPIDNKIINTQIKLIAEAIQSKDCSNNVHINLQHNSIDDEGATLLSDACKSGKIGLNLDLSNNKIGDKGATTFANGIKSGKYPYYFNLNLVNNNITSTGAKALLNALKSRNRTYGLKINVSWRFNHDDNNFKQQYSKMCEGLEDIERQAFLKNNIRDIKTIIEAMRDTENNILEELPNFSPNDLGKASINLEKLYNSAIELIKPIKANSITLSRSRINDYLFEHKWIKEAAIYKETLSNNILEELKNQFIRQIRTNHFLDTHGVICFTFLLCTKDFLPTDIIRYILFLEIINISIDDLIDIENETTEYFAQELSKQTAERYSYSMKNTGFFKIKPEPTVDIETLQQHFRSTLSFGIQTLLDKNNKPVNIGLRHGEMIIIFDSNSDGNTFLKALNKDTYLFQKEVKLDNRKEIDYVIKNICKLDPDDVYQVFPEFLSPAPKNSWFF